VIATVFYKKKAPCRKTARRPLQFKAETA